MSIALVFAVVMLAFNLLSFVFLIAYLLFWKRMRVWFNEKAGVDFMQENRVGPDQKRIIIVGAAFAVVLVILNICGFDDWATKIGGFAFVAAAAWSFVRYRRLIPTMGERAARWSSIFHFGANITVVAIVVSLSAFAIMLFVGIMLMGKISDFATGSMSTGSSGDSFIKGVGKVTDMGEEVTVDQHSDGTFRDFHGNEYRENQDGSLHRRV